MAFVYIGLMTMKKTFVNVYPKTTDKIGNILKFFESCVPRPSSKLRGYKLRNFSKE